MSDIADSVGKVHSAFLAMTGFVETAALVRLPKQIPVLPAPAKSISIQDLNTNVSAHAHDWPGHLEAIIEVAGAAKDQAQTAIDVIESIVEDSNNIAASQSAEEQAKLKADWLSRLSLLYSATTNQYTATQKLKERLIAYSALLKADSQHAVDVREDYKSATQQNADKIAQFEKQEGLADSASLLQRIREKVDELQAEIDRETAAVTAGQAMTGIGILFFPLLIAGAVTWGVEADALKTSKEEMVKLQEELKLVTTFNEFEVFFGAVDGMLTNLAKSLDQAVIAMADIAGIWNLMQTDCKNLIDGSSGLKRLTPPEFIVPLSKFSTATPLATFKRLVENSDAFIANAYVTHMDVSDIGKAKAKSHAA